MRSKPSLCNDSFSLAFSAVSPLLVRIGERHIGDAVQAFASHFALFVLVHLPDIPGIDKLGVSAVHDRGKEEMQRGETYCP